MKMDHPIVIVGMEPTDMGGLQGALSGTTASEMVAASIRAGPAAGSRAWAIWITRPSMSCSKWNAPNDKDGQGLHPHHRGFPA